MAGKPKNAELILQALHWRGDAMTDALKEAEKRLQDEFGDYRPTYVWWRSKAISLQAQLDVCCEAVKKGMTENEGLRRQDDTLTERVRILSVELVAAKERIAELEKPAEPEAEREAFEKWWISGNKLDTFEGFAYKVWRAAWQAALEHRKGGK